ncbi:MAG: hypothetical protein KBA18_03840 [Kiritimatiellae bacterium]|nr:hypothetical protein [Kiritimatiellia bacterium]
MIRTTPVDVVISSICRTDSSPMPMKAASSRRVMSDSGFTAVYPFFLDGGAQSSAVPVLPADKGEKIERANFAVVESPIALDRILAVQYFRRNLALRDWSSFLDVYGIPSMFFIGPPGVTEEKEKQYLAIAQDLVKDGRGCLPNGTDVKYVSGGGTRVGNAHQKAFNQVAKADSVMVTEALRRDFDKPLLDAAFPGWPVEAGFRLTPEVVSGIARVASVAR